MKTKIMLTLLSCLLLAGGPVSPNRKAEASASQGGQATATSTVFSDIATGMEHSYQEALEIPHSFWNPKEEITLTAYFSPLTREDVVAQRYKGRWERLAAALRAPENAGRRFLVRVTVADDRKRKVVWHQDLPIDAEALAAATRKLIPDQTIRSITDLDVILGFRIPPAALPPATYRAYMTFLTPDSAEHHFPSDTRFEDSEVFVVRTAPFDINRVLMPSQTTDAPDLLTRAVELGNPARRQFPLDTPDDCQARSIWSLQTYQGRIFVGYGDWVLNRGPIDLWSFAPESAPNAPLATRNPGRRSFLGGEKPRVLFTQEYVVQDHSIDLFRACGARLYVPGMDGNREKGPDGDLFSNLYVREKGHWRKLSSIPQSTHTLDALEQAGRLYAVAVNEGSNLWMSRDGGVSWTALNYDNKPVYTDSLARFRDGVLVFGGMDTVYFCKEGRLERHLVELSPGYTFAAPTRRQAFLNGVVYTNDDHWGSSKEPRHPLFYLGDFTEGARIIAQFKDSEVRDLCVEDGVLYVLTSQFEDPLFTGEIYATRDLKHWTRRARFSALARPNSFAMLDGAFYIGLANRGYDPKTYVEKGEHAYAYADKSSGSIWRLEH
ncbi:MAG: hypothetical protein JWL77_522 [Chthonomonadaceae bacterium]|nr:hypothetical protein [Chthonomonadaceae bacterium]